jgi:hypothetical protein
MLQVAINEYDQAVLDLAASVINSDFHQPSTSLTRIGIYNEQGKARRQHQDEQFLNWLSPSHWLVEGQLSTLRRQRGKDTLQWARNMSELGNWRKSQMDLESRERVLWIRGTLGMGKSVMAAYFVELLKCSHPASIVAYFFCRSSEERLRKAREIIRVLAYYQCIQGSEEAHGVLESLRSTNFRIDENIGIRLLFEKLKEPLSPTGKEVYIIVDGWMKQIPLQGLWKPHSMPRNGCAY